LVCRKALNTQPPTLSLLREADRILRVDRSNENFCRRSEDRYLHSRTRQIVAERGAQSETNVKEPAREWSELGSRDIDHRTRGARVRARETIESSLSEFRHNPASI